MTVARNVSRQHTLYLRLGYTRQILLTLYPCLSGVTVQAQLFLYLLPVKTGSNGCPCSVHAARRQKRLRV